ncbi:MAG: CocE/NonD family hydrolase [Bryobacterales bacterium]|nr:CocE/NonD family hydrolase [Bryobacterales bacterium]
MSRRLFLALAAPLVLIGQPFQRQTVRIPMRDAVELAADVYTHPGGGKGPVLLMRTPYNKDAQRETAERYARAGYAVVVEDTRGRYASSGATLPYNNEGQDGFDTLEWISRQPWSNGRVGMWGASHPGAVQWQAAAEGAYGLAVLAPTATWSSFYRNIYVGGAARLALIARAAAGPRPGVDWSKVLLHLPLTEMDRAIGGEPLPWLTGILSHNKPDGFLKRLDLTREVEALRLPAQHIVGYYDFFSRESVANFQRLRRNGNQQLILGPWDHGTVGKRKVGEVDFGAAAEIDVVEENLAWFDRFLKEADPKPFPPVRYFSMGDGVWRTSRDWPPPQAQQASFYLRDNGSLSWRAPKDAPPEDKFRTDPANPAPAVPENEARGKYAAIWGPVDQGRTAPGDEQLTYDLTLSEAIEFAGPIRAELWVSANTPDADWVVKLISVRPCGFAQNLAVGIQRGSFRESELHPTPLVPGKVYKINVDVGHAAAHLPAGHILRVQIAGAYFPIYDRNTNTGDGPEGKRTLVSTQSVWHTPAMPSRIVLPVLNRKR